MEDNLIHIVKSYRLLYDTNHVDYMRTKLKYTIWEKVAKKTSMKSGAEAKALWEKLRHSYRDALRRQQKCLKSGTPASAIKPWRFQNRMSFLLPFMVNKEREGFTIEEFVDNNSIQNVEENIQEDTPQPQSMSPENEITRENLFIKIAEDSPPGSPAAKKLRKDKIISILEELKYKAEERAIMRDEERRKFMELIRPSEDPLYHFFLSMYEATKNMPLAYRHEVRKRVFTTVSDAEAALLYIPSTSTQQNLRPTNDVVGTPFNSAYTAYMQGCTRENSAPTAENSAPTAENSAPAADSTIKTEDNL